MIGLIRLVWLYLKYNNDGSILWSLLQRSFFRIFEIISQIKTILEFGFFWKAKKCEERLKHSKRMNCNLLLFSFSNKKQKFFLAKSFVFKKIFNPTNPFQGLWNLLPWSFLRIPNPTCNSLKTCSLTAPH